MASSPNPRFRIMRQCMLVTLLLLAGRTPPVCAGEPQREFERSFTIAGAIELDVETRAGAVTIRPGTGDGVSIRGHIRRRPTWSGANISDRQIEYIRTNPPVTRDGNLVRLGRVPDETLWRAASIGYEISVPPRANIRIRTESGAVSIAGIDGQVSIETGSSGVEASDISGTISVETGSGRIGLRLAPSGSASVRSGSGSVEIRGARQSLDVETRSSSISVDGTPGGPWTAVSNSGAINVRVSANAAFAVDAVSRSGQIRIEHPVTGATAPEKHRVQGEVRGGGALVRLSTGSSGITVR